MVEPKSDDRPAWIATTDASLRATNTVHRGHILHGRRPTTPNGLPHPHFQPANDAARRVVEEAHSKGPLVAPPPPDYDEPQRRCPPQAHLKYVGRNHRGESIFTDREPDTREVPEAPLFRLGDPSKRSVVGGMVRGPGETFALYVIGRGERALIEPVNDAARAVLARSRPTILAGS
jgi:hypothetical protein